MKKIFVGLIIGFILGACTISYAYVARIILVDSNERAISASNPLYVIAR